MKKKVEEDEMVTKEEKKAAEDQKQSRLKSLRKANLLGMLTHGDHSHEAPEPAQSLAIPEEIEDLHMHNIEKKATRKLRYLFAFPGIFQLTSSTDVIGSIKGFHSNKNHVLYLDFPEGRMKFVGQMVHTKNRLLTFQCTKQAVNCQDSFDKTVIFSEAQWIGKVEDNPTEKRLPLPENFMKLLEKNDDMDCIEETQLLKIKKKKQASEKDKQGHYQKKRRKTSGEEGSDDEYTEKNLSKEKEPPEQEDPKYPKRKTRGRIANYKAKESSSSDEDLVPSKRIKISTEVKKEDEDKVNDSGDDDPDDDEDIIATKARSRTERKAQNQAIKKEESEELETKDKKEKPTRKRSAMVHIEKKRSGLSAISSDSESEEKTPDKDDKKNEIEKTENEGIEEDNNEDDAELSSDTEMDLLSSSFSSFKKFKDSGSLDFGFI